MASRMERIKVSRHGSRHGGGPLLLNDWNDIRSFIYWWICTISCPVVNWKDLVCMACLGLFVCRRILCCWLLRVECAFAQMIVFILKSWHCFLPPLFNRESTSVQFEETCLSFWEAWSRWLGVEHLFKSFWHISTSVWYGSGHMKILHIALTLTSVKKALSSHWFGQECVEIDQQVFKRELQLSLQGPGRNS